MDGPDTPENGTVLGVDLGVGIIAVTSTGVFWSGSKLDRGHRDYEQCLASMQKRGTRYAHEAMKRVGEKETGRFELMHHGVATGIVRAAIEGECSPIAFGDLIDVRVRLPQARWHRVWAFRRLNEFVECKAEELSIAVE